MAAAAQGLGYLNSFFVFVQRFVIPPARMAVVQLTSAIVNAVAMVSAVAMLTGVAGYTAGLAASALTILIVNGTVTVRAFRAAGVSRRRTRTAPDCFPFDRPSIPATRGHV